MPPSSLPEQQVPDTVCASASSGGIDGSRSESSRGRSHRTRVTSRRRVLAVLATTATAGLAGCAGRLPGEARSVDATARTDSDTVVWDYPADAVADGENFEGIGYAAVRLQALDVAETEASASAVLRFRLNSTVGRTGAAAPSDGYQADWFRFRIGVPRTYEDVSALRAFVQPTAWPALETTYGYRETFRELVVAAPDVHEDGTITVTGRLQPSGRTLPRRLRCQFAVQASQSSPLGRTVVADGTETFDLSALDLPRGVTLDE